MKHAIVSGGLALSALVGSLAVARPASASFVLCNYANTQLCLTNAGAQNGQPITVNWFSPGVHQLWNTLEWMDTDFAELVSRAGTNQCLGVAGGNMNNGTGLVSWNCNNNLSSPDQAWKPILITYSAAGAPCYTFVDEPTATWATPRVFGVAGGHVVNGAHVILWDYMSSAPDQLWCLMNEPG